MSEDKSVRLWEVATGRELAAFHGHTHFVYALAFHPDGRRILSGSLDGTVKVWDAVTSRPIVFRGHSIWVSKVAFSRDGRRVLLRNHDPAHTTRRRRDQGLGLVHRRRNGPLPGLRPDPTMNSGTAASSATSL